MPGGPIHRESPGDGASLVSGLPDSESKVIEWRADRLFLSGLDPRRAYHYAALRDALNGVYALDVHEYESYVDRGASPDQALELALSLEAYVIPSAVEPYGLSEAS